MRSEIIFLASFFLMPWPAAGQSQLPNPVKTCEDVRAYIGPDQSMTMDMFKSLLTASGTDLSKGGDQTLDMQCKAVPAVKHVIMIQHVTGAILVKTHVIIDGGICKLTEISLMGC